MQKLLLSLPKDFFTNGSEMEEAIYKSVQTTQELKLLFALLSIFNFNFQRNVFKHVLNLENINSKNSFLKQLRIKKDDIIDIVMNLKCEYISEIKLCDNNIVFKVSEKYLKAIAQQEIVYIDFDDIIKYRTNAHIAAHLKVQYFGNYSAKLNYLEDLFNINPDAKYTNKVLQVKRVFSKVNILQEEVEFTGKKNGYIFIAKKQKIVDFHKERAKINAIPF